MNPDALPLVLASDPATNSGFAMFLPEQERRTYSLARYGLLKPTTSKKIDALFVDAEERATKLGCPLMLATETQYLGMNPKSLIVVVEHRMRWQTIAELFEAKVEAFAPETWQSKMLGARRGMKRAERKQWAQRHAIGFFDGADFTQDEADATVLGCYACRLQVARILHGNETHPFVGERL